jgi:hypothetical protein
MFAKMGHGWAMAKGSFAVLKRYPGLAIFPIISGLIFFLIAGGLIVSLAPEIGLFHQTFDPVWDRLGSTDAGQIKFYIAAFVVIYILTVVAVFCNVALIYCVLRCFQGQEPSIGDGFTAAVGRLPQILGWALVAATIGVILNIIECFLRDKLGFLGSFIGKMFEFGWAVVTFFVLPVLVVEGLGPIAAVRRSSSILKQKWGESLAGGARFGLLGVLFALIAMAIFGLGMAIVFSKGVGGLGGLGVLLMAIGVAVFLASIVVLQALNTIFLSGVYLYATTGQVPASLDPEMVQGAFRPKS